MLFFSLEELHRNFSIMVLLPSMVCRYDSNSYLPSSFLVVLQFLISLIYSFLPINHYGILIIVAIAAGLAGVVFNQGLLNVHRFFV